MTIEKIKLALICTQGGHFEQLTNLSELYNRYDHFWITNENNQTRSALSTEKIYFVAMAHFKKPWSYLEQVPTFLKVFRKEKPTHILSTGSGRTAFIPLIYSKLFGINFLYIDTFSRVNGYSKFGSFLLLFGQQIFCQWEDNKNQKAVYIGPVFKKIQYSNNIQVSNSDYIFVTVGTRSEPFTRLIKYIDDLKKEGTIKEKVIVQAGRTKYTSDNLEIFDFCSPDEIEELIDNAKFVVTQESAGIGSICLKHQTRFIVVPRDYKHGELPTKSDMKEDLHFKLEEMGYTNVVNNLGELKKSIKNIVNLKTGFPFDNTLAIQKLTDAIKKS